MNTKFSKAGIGRRLGVMVLGALFSVCALAPLTAHAQVNIANVPLFVSPGVDPNIMFTIDDSGSMHWEHLPDDTMGLMYYAFPPPANLYGAANYTARVPDFNDANIHNRFHRSSQNNAVFYNPRITYQPWVNHENVSMGDAPPTAAPYNPADLTRGVLNLTAQQTQSARWYRNLADDRNANFWTCGPPCDQTYWPITFYDFQGGDPSVRANYTRYQIRGTAGYTSTLPGGAETELSQFVWNTVDAQGNPVTITRDVAQEAANFANWFTYYRSRILASRGGIGRAFAQQSDRFRVGFGSLNSGRNTSTGACNNPNNVDGVNTCTIVSGVRPFSGASREAFFNTLYSSAVPAANTPLRVSLQAAGEYYSRTDNAGPWGAIPGTNNSSDHLECRQSYTILMSDGYWNGPNPGVGNQDGAGNTLHFPPDGDGEGYTVRDPFRDNFNDTLADVAMHYWKNDLRTGLDNRVPTNPPWNPAFWQHMVTYTVGLGIVGTIDPDEARAAVVAPPPPTPPTAIAWPNPGVTNNNPAKVDDMLHAAINARGDFFSASDPDTFAKELSGVLDNIASRVEASATSAAASTAVLQSDSLIYLAGFRSTDWSGQLKAFNLNANGTTGSQAWDAEDRLRTNSVADRNIFTRTDGGDTVALNFASLSPDQKNALNTAVDGPVDNRGADRISWLRGNDVSGLRSRTPESGVDAGAIRRLGDIIGSSPRFVGRTNFGYSWIGGAEGQAYSTFRTSPTYQNRPDMLYVGANDGMVHGFDGQTGDERFAYIPSELLMPETAGGHARINRLMDPAYGHRFFMDGNLTVADAYWGTTWKSVLVGTMGAGGRTVFALDVSNPTSFGTGNVLWEFTHPDLGYGVTDPAIVRLANGTWAAVFGNGYNGADQKAKLFVVRMSDGALIRAIDTGVGSAASPNGLASPAVTAWPSGGVNASYAYAGDLHGNVWRFKLTGNVSTWSATRLFQATDPDGNPQPITTRVRTVPHPDAADTLVVLFGTGSYFRPEDDNVLNPQVQTLYGVYDKGATSADLERDDLLAQHITWQGEKTFDTSTGSVTYALRQISDNDLAGQPGWRLDLVYGSQNGERVISPASFPSGFVGDRVRFTSLIPDPDPCGPGRSGYIMDISLTSGGVYPYAVFDLDKDGVVDNSDNDGGPPYTGISGGSGEVPIIVQTPDGGTEMIIFGDLGSAEGGEDCEEGEDCEPCEDDDVLCGATADTSGRQLWRQIR